MRNAFDDVRAELERARAKFPTPFASAHEGFAILNEERDELWDEVKGNALGRRERMREEAIQVAAMAIRFVEEVCDTSSANGVPMGTIVDSLVGKKVIVRTVNAGVHFGTLRKKKGDEVVLDGARRIWRWFGANTCSEISLTGIDSGKSRVAKPVDGHWLKGAIEILECQPEASKTIEAAAWAP